jgi:hypothetical protein
VNTALGALAAALGWTIPSELAVIAARLSSSRWPEVVDRWSRLTPSGFPVELMVTPEAAPRWASEIAGPEIPDSERIELVAAHLAAAAQPIAPSLLDTLSALQRNCALRWGAWIGGRRVHDATHFKLYSEVSRTCPFAALPLPDALRPVLARLPAGAYPSQIGVSPLISRVELYVGLPMIGIDDLRPAFTAARCPWAVEAIARVLPDSLRRLAGRRLGISLASGPDSQIDFTVFGSVRTLFPGATECIGALVPRLADISGTIVRPTIFAMTLQPNPERVALGVGVTHRAGVPDRAGSVDGASGASGAG